MTAAKKWKKKVSCLTENIMDLTVIVIKAFGTRGEATEQLFLSVVSS
jgi:hypothetical protein